MAQWLTLGISLLKLINALVEMARASKQRDEGAAAALTRVTNDATETVQQARAARTAAAARDATDAGLQQPDGWQRD